MHASVRSLTNRKCPCTRLEGGDPQKRRQGASRDKVALSRGGALVSLFQQGSGYTQPDQPDQGFALIYIFDICWVVEEDAQKGWPVYFCLRFSSLGS